MKNDQKARWNCMSVSVCRIVCPTYFFSFFVSCSHSHFFPRHRHSMCVCIYGCCVLVVVVCRKGSFSTECLRTQKENCSCVIIAIQWHSVYTQVRIHLFQFDLCRAVCVYVLETLGSTWKLWQKSIAPKTMLKLKRWHTNAFVSLIHSQHNRQHTRAFKVHWNRAARKGETRVKYMIHINNSTKSPFPRAPPPKRKKLFSVSCLSGHQNTFHFRCWAFIQTHHPHIRQNEQFHNGK